MSDEDLWRPPASGSGAESGPGSEEGRPALDETQPLSGPPPSPGDTPSYDPPPPSPGSVPPRHNPYAAPSPQGPYGAPAAQPVPPANPYPQPGSFDQYAAPNPYGAQPYGGYPAGYGAGLPDHPSASTAMVLGIVGLVGIALCGGLTLVLSPFAWGIGRRAVREIDADPAKFGGRDKANAGKIMGIIGTVLLVLAVVLLVLAIGLLVAFGTSDQPTVVFPSPTGGGVRS